MLPVSAAASWCRVRCKPKGKGRDETPGKYRNNEAGDDSPHFGVGNVSHRGLGSNHACQRVFDIYQERKSPYGLGSRPLFGLKAFTTTIDNDINDLPLMSPHGKDSRTMQKIEDFQLIQTGRMAQQRHTATSCSSA